LQVGSNTACGLLHLATSEYIHYFGG